MRVTLVAVLAAAALIVPVAVWYRPTSAPAAEAAELERPDRVLLAGQHDYLPFGCTETSSCCRWGALEAALLVTNEAMWFGTNADVPVHIPRDGREWETLDVLLRQWRVDGEVKFEVAVHDDARYEDLLVAMVVARAAGAYPRVVQPALPVFPHHGIGGGLPRDFSRGPVL
jgi:hypothetical protein